MQNHILTLNQPYKMQVRLDMSVRGTTRRQELQKRAVASVNFDCAVEEFSEAPTGEALNMLIAAAQAFLLHRGEAVVPSQPVADTEPREGP